MKKVFLRIVLSFVVLAALWVLQSYLAGEKPDREFAEYQHEQYEQDLIKLRAAAVEEKRNPAPHRKLISALLEGLSAPGEADLEKFKELISELELVTTLDPKDDTALIMLADIHFNRKSFKESIEYYQKYLALKPNDTQVRGRYASALTFLSRFDQAIKELKSIIKDDPNNFHAFAYLSITYSQMKKNEEAKAAGIKALSLAPTAEARQRFGAYLVSIGSIDANELKAEPSTEEELPEVVTARNIINHLRANPIAGPKYHHFEYPENSRLLIYFQDFPVDKMPEFARNKFVNGIKERIQEPVEEVIILEATSGKEMLTISKN